LCTCVLIECLRWSTARCAKAAVHVMCVPLSHRIWQTWCCELHCVWKQPHTNLFGLNEYMPFMVVPKEYISAGSSNIATTCNFRPFDFRPFEFSALRIYATLQLSYEWAPSYSCNTRWPSVVGLWFSFCTTSGHSGGFLLITHVPIVYKIWTADMVKKLRQSQNPRWPLTFIFDLHVAHHFAIGIDSCWLWLPLWTISTS